MKPRKFLLLSVLSLLVFAMLLGACQPAPAEPAQEAAPAEESPTSEEAAAEESPTSEEAAPAEEQPAAETEEVEVEEPAVSSGGTITFAESSEFTTLDVQKVSGLTQLYLLSSASLLTRDPNTFELVPYLAESYTISEDGLVYEFVLKQNVKFNNGDPLTAEDWVYTIQRAKDPEMASPFSGSIFGPVVEYEAVDDYTLRLTLEKPNYTFIDGLTSAAAQPVSQQAIEEWGDNYDFHPVSVGPFVFDEYVVGEKVVLVSNPDYDWAPPFLDPGPPQIDSVVIRFLPEYATLIAGLEAGEIDYGEISLQDVTRVVENPNLDIVEGFITGMWPFVSFNVGAAPFDNLLVRQAFSYAINRDALVTIMLQGHGDPLYGPLNKGTIGYEPSQEEYGYRFDLEKAKELMQEAGYTYDENGMLLTPEGEPFVLDLPVTDISGRGKLTEVLAEQFKQLGVHINIQLKDFGLWWSQLESGDYQITVHGLSWGDAEILYMSLHSSGSYNLSRIDEPVLDEYLDRINTEINPENRQEAINSATQYIMENALYVPLYNCTLINGINSSVKGYMFNPQSKEIWLNNAYIEE